MTRKAVRTFPSVATLVVIASISAGVADDADDAKPQADAAANEDVPPITIRLQDVQPRAAFESLFKQVELELPKEWENHWTTTGPIDVEVVEQPFWRAVESLYEQTGVALVPSQRGLRVERPPAWIWGNRPTAAGGAFVAVALSAQRSDTVRFARPDDRRREVQLTVVLYGDPRLRVAPHEPFLDVTEAVDEAGRSLLAKPPAGAPAGGKPAPPPPAGPPSRYESGWQLIGRLRLPEAHGQRIARLKAVARLTADVKADLWEVPDPLDAANVTRKVNGFAVTLVKVRPVNGAFLVSISTERGDGDVAAFARHIRLIQAWLGRVRLIDAKGRTLRSTGGGGASWGPDRGEFHYEHHPETADGEDADERKPVKFAWRVPETTREIEVPFELTDLPLPRW